MNPERRYRSARGIEIAQCRDDRLSRLRIGGHRADDDGDRSRIIGTDRNIVLDIQQRALLQLTSKPRAVPQVFMQPSGKQRQGVAVTDLRCRAKAFIESTANNAVMVDQGERFIGDDFF